MSKNVVLYLRKVFKGGTEMSTRFRIGVPLRTGMPFRLNSCRRQEFFFAVRGFDEKMEEST